MIWYGMCIYIYIISGFLACLFVGSFVCCCCVRLGSECTYCERIPQTRQAAEPLSHQHFPSDKHRNVAPAAAGVGQAQLPQRSAQPFEERETFH